MTRRRQMAAEFGFQKKNPPLSDRDIPPMREAVISSREAKKNARHRQEKAELRAIVPPTHIADKYKSESSAVGVGEHYRRTLVNVTAKNGELEKRAQHINVETLLGLSVSESVADVVDPSVASHLTTKVIRTK